MIQLRLRFSEDDGPVQKIPIIEGELLSAAMARSLDGVPLGTFKIEETFQATVNGLHVVPELWAVTALREQDTVIISPLIKDGDAGQIFKQAAILVIAVAASYYLGPQAGYGIYGAFAAAAITVGASLLLNALIPPPVPKSGDIGFSPGLEGSQMYSITGQSNQMNRLGTVMKVYGSHRVFPNLAALPYTELGVASTATRASRVIQDLTYTAVDAGSPGNDITIQYTNTGIAGAETVSVKLKAITVGIQSGVSTAAQIRTKVLANGDAAALVTVALTGSTTKKQITSQGMNLQSGTGETVQYLYGIYDFGLGAMNVTDIMIGDTPLTTDSFSDFQYNLVDPNRPDIAADVFDQRLAKNFNFYKGRREITPLSIALTDGLTTIQNTDPNTGGDPQEIILDLVADRGLYGFSSNGQLGARSVRLEIHFALVGTEDWHAYNDMNFVESYKSVGGTDETDFEVPLIPTVNTESAIDQFYGAGIYNPGYNNPYTNNRNQAVLVANLRGSSVSLLVPTSTSPSNEYLVGAKVFLKDGYLGKIVSIAPYSNPVYTVLTLDNNFQRFPSNGGAAFSDIPIYFYRGNPVTYSSGGVFHRDWEWNEGPFDIQKIRTSRHESGIAVVTGESSSPVYTNIRFKPLVAGQYKVRIKRVSAYGTWNTEVSDDLTFGAITTAYTGNPIVTDKRHTFMEIRIKATDQLNGNINTLSAVCQAVIPVYDSNTELWTRNVTSNPAWIFADLLTGEVNKRAISVDKLHLPSLVEWANYCDELPTPPGGQTYGDPRFTCNFVLDYTTTLQDLLAQVGGTAQASLNIIDGKYGVLIDKFKSTPVQIFTPRNSRDFSSTRIYGPRPHALKIKYIDPNRAWEVSETIAYDNGYDVTNATVFDDLTAFACTSSEQAWRFGRYMIAQNRLRQETISILVDFEHIVCTRGDYVQITQDVMKAGGIPARVKSIIGSTIIIDDSIDIIGGVSYGYVFRSSNGTVSTSTLTAIAPNQFTLAGATPDPGNLIVIGAVGQIVIDCIVKAISPNDDTSASLVLIEKADAIFDYESTGVLPDYDPQISITSMPDIRPPLAVQNLTIADNLYECAATKSGYAYYIDLVWDAPLGSVFENYEVYVNDGRGYKLFNSTTNKLFRYTVDQSRLDIQHSFKVAAVSATGKKLQIIQMSEVITTPLTKVTPPSNVSNFSSSITNQVLQLNWSAIDDCDAYKYVIRYSPDTNDVWESSIPLTTVSKTVTSSSIQARTGVYLIKALDFAGNESAQATAVITTIPNLFDLNIIEEMNEAPTFLGVLDNIELLGEAVILTEEVPGDQDFVQYYSSGYYEFAELLDIGDIYSVRLQSLIHADGLKKGELMSDWVSLATVDHLNTALHSDWSVALQYRTTEAFSAMSDWVHLSLIDHINFGAGVGFTDWRDIPTTGDATGRVFQFRVKLESLTANVTPRVFDTTVSADMPDRVDSFENQLSTASGAYTVSYDPVFKGPGTSPNVQISIDNGATGDYWTFENKTLEGFGIRFYDKNGIQVARQFDVVAKGYGHRHTVTI